MPIKLIYYSIGKFSFGLLLLLFRFFSVSVSLIRALFHSLGRSIGILFSVACCFLFISHFHFHSDAHPFEQTK